MSERKSHVAGQYDCKTGSRNIAMYEIMIYTLIRSYQATGNTADRHHTGHPRVTTPAENDMYV